MNLLINETFLKIHPQTAAKIGLNEAMLLQRIHELSFGEDDIDLGTQRVRRSYKEWNDVLPFWSMATVIRTIRKLEKNGYILSERINLGEKRYLVNYDICEANDIDLLSPVCAEIVTITE